MKIVIRAFSASDGDAVNRIALAAWDEYRTVFENWSRMEDFFKSAATLAADADLLVAESEGELLGWVGYVGPGRKRDSIFPADWAVIRMLSVDPRARGHGLGRRLSEECVTRAQREGVPTIGLHTSPVMKVALPLYLRMGFVLHTDLGIRSGVPYAVYARRVTP